MSKCENCGLDVPSRRKGYKSLEGKMVCRECQIEADSQGYSDLCDMILGR